MPLIWNPSLDPRASISGRSLVKLFSGPWSALTFHLQTSPVLGSRSLRGPPNIPDDLTGWCSPGALQPSRSHMGMMEKPTFTHWDWRSLVLWLLPQGKRREEQCSDFSRLADFELEVICPALDYMVFTIPALITPISLSNPCVTSRKNCKHVRLLFPANSLGDQCQTRLCLQTSLALATRDGDRVTFLVNRQLDFHLGAWWILLLLLFWTEG